ncbi:unnamed protein product [Durusdinium trenchii]|uniref:Pseudouridylate synthase 7 homolog n=2 Tax=Durusdinium trenchii TaxID=1381693 RepID=A0ABP0JY56_9DINO
MDCGSLRGIADEVDCGISAFINWELTPIGGSLKSCPEDFVVEELPLEDFEEEASDALPFLRFRLTKRGLDTLEAVDALANACHLSAQKFGFAGIKDSFAITTQEITVEASAISEAALRNVVKEHLPYMEVNHFRRCPKRLVPGQLKGNRFILRVRGVSPSAVPAAMESLQSRGFINYVGMQRFGKGGLRSDQLGLAYLQKNYERCVDLLLRQAGDDTVSLGPGRLPKWAEVFRRTHSADAALRRLPVEGVWAERRLLQSLKRRQELDGGTAGGTAGRMVGHGAPKKGGEGSWLEVAKEAFLALPRSIRALYAHSYVDRLWNLAATERITRYGAEHLTEGDLMSSEGNFRLLTPTDAVADIFQLLLPRPGSGMQLPANTVGHFMQSYLQYDSLQSEELNLEQPGGTWWQLTGCMRPVVVRPQQFTWHLEVNTDEQPATLIRAACSNGSTEPARVTRATNHFSRVRAKKEAPGSNLILDFHLGPGQYATMAMREVMRARSAPTPRHIVFSSSSGDDVEPRAERTAKRRTLEKTVERAKPRRGTHEHRFH